MKKKILLLGFAVFMSGSTAFAVENTTLSGNFSEQSCGLSDNRLCNAVSNELIKELLKQTVYTVGTQVLNKYMNSNTTTPVAVPAPVVYTTTPAPVVYAATPAPVVSAPVNTVTTVTTAPEEQMIIIN